MFDFFWVRGEYWSPLLASPCCYPLVYYEFPVAICCVSDVAQCCFRYSRASLRLGQCSRPSPSSCVLLYSAPFIINLRFTISVPSSSASNFMPLFQISACTYVRVQQALVYASRYEHKLCPVSKSLWYQCVRYHRPSFLRVLVELPWCHFAFSGLVFFFYEFFVTYWFIWGHTGAPRYISYVRLFAWFREVQFSQKLFRYLLFPCAPHWY